MNSIPPPNPFAPGGPGGGGGGGWSPPPPPAGPPPPPPPPAPRTRTPAEAAMRELLYFPNQVAGALASARSGSVGVLVPTIANSIFADTVQGLSDELEPLGYAVILAQSRYADA